MNKNIFKQVRINAGLSQCEYAKILGMSQTFVSMMENGHYPISDNTRRKVVANFEITDRLISQLDGLKKLG